MYLAWSIYIIWFVFLVGSFYSISKLERWRSYSAFIAISGLLGFIVFTYVFILNRGSSVAQLSESRELWSLWFDFWLPLSLLALACLLSCICWLVVRAIKRDNLNQLGYLAILLGQTLLNSYHVILNMPDA